MGGTRRMRVIIVTAIVAMAAVASITATDLAGATPGTPFAECPTVGVDTSCGALITVNPNGSTSFATDPSQASYSGHGDVLVGVLNDSNAVASTVTLTGTGIFAFDGHGLCAVHPTPCFSHTEYGPTGYEGPGIAFSTTDTSDGSVTFNGGLSPGTTTYFSLAASSITVTGDTLAPDVDLSVSPVTAQAGISSSPSIASFIDGGSDVAPSSFTATISWGDSVTSPGVITQPGGPGSPYLVTGTHSYKTEGGYTTGVTVTDTSLALNTATANGEATVTDPAITASSVSIATQTTGEAATVPVATFSDANPAAPISEFTAAISWGDSSSSFGTVTQPGGAGTTFDVTGTHSYAASGGYTVTVVVSDPGGSSSTASEPVTVDNAVITCSGSGCQGSVSTPTQSLSVASTSTTGTIQIALQTYNGSLNCGDPYRHAPQITTVVDSGLAAGSSINLTITFPKADVTGPADIPLAVCYSSNTPFTDLEGVQTTLGLLPACGVLRQHPKVGPCISKISRFPFGPKTLVEKLIVPESDPRAH